MADNSEAEKAGFLGRGWAFPPTFVRSTGGVAMVAGVDDILTSLGILLATELGERVMRPDYGCDLHSVLFEDLDSSATGFVKDLVETAILYHEPRIRLEQVHLAPVPEDGRVDIMIDFVVRATNTRHNYVYPFYIGEGTNLRR